MRKLVLVFVLLLLCEDLCFAKNGEWQDIGNRCWRLRVPHGWLVRTKIGYGEGLCFYPDENHEWID